MEHTAWFGKSVSCNINYTGFLANGLNIQNHQHGSLNTWVNRCVSACVSVSVCFVLKAEGKMVKCHIVPAIGSLGRKPAVPVMPVAFLC